MLPKGGTAGTKSYELEVEDGVPVLGRTSSPLGRPNSGLDILDLFNHSYLPPPQQSGFSGSRWVWVKVARVWDKDAVHFPGTREEVRRFGAKAKFLRPVVPSTTDSRSFV